MRFSKLRLNWFFFSPTQKPNLMINNCSHDIWIPTISIFKNAFKFTLYSSRKKIHHIKIFVNVFFCSLTWWTLAFIWIVTGLSARASILTWWRCAWNIFWFTIFSSISSFTYAPKNKKKKTKKYEMELIYLWKYIHHCKLISIESIGYAVLLLV